MQTSYNTSKLILKALVIFTLMLFSFKLTAQDGIVWAQMPNFDNANIQSSNNKLTSSNTELQELINTYSINKIEKAVPASRKASLKNLIEITCNCNETDLLLAISKLSNHFTQPEIGPHYQTLVLPDDYSLTFSDDYALDLINAPQAWDITTGDSTLVIAISDQNFYINHEDLAGKIHFYDASNTAYQGHGTAVAVTAAGNTNNAAGKSSIGYNSELALYQMSYNDLLMATYAGHRVINASWASGCAYSEYIQSIIDEIYENGSIVVAAAGNGGTCGGPENWVFPAACNHVISVTGIGSMDNHELVAGDPTKTLQHNTQVDICAPGLLVPLTTAPGYYITGNGSSFAAPFVSGTIALMLSVDTCLTFEDIEEILYATTVNIDSLNPDYAGLLGHGRLDAGAAVAMASIYMSCNRNGVGEPEIVSPTPTPTPTPSPNPYETYAYDDKLVIEEAITGTDELESNESLELTVFPNPTIAGGSITIQSTAKIEKCEIVNVNGEIIQILVPVANKIIVSNLNQGAYFARVNFENGVTKIKRMIII